MHQTYVLRFSISIGKWEPSNEPSNPSWCCRPSTSPRPSTSTFVRSLL